MWGGGGWGGVYLCCSVGRCVAHGEVGGGLGEQLVGDGAVEGVAVVAPDEGLRFGRTGRAGGGGGQM